MMKNKEDWKFDKDKASKALQTLSCHVNPFRDKNVAELVRVITYCMDLEQSLDKACELLADGGVVQCEDCFKNPKCSTLEIVNNCYFDKMTKEEWKEWWCKEDAE